MLPRRLRSSDEAVYESLCYVTLKPKEVLDHPVIRCSFTTYYFVFIQVMLCVDALTSFPWLDTSPFLSVSYTTRVLRVVNVVLD